LSVIRREKDTYGTERTVYSLALVPSPPRHPKLQISRILRDCSRGQWLACWLGESSGHTKPWSTNDKSLHTPKHVGGTWYRQVVNKKGIQHFNFKLTHTTLKNVELLKHFKISKTTPTCFGLQGNHHQGATATT